jgi:hypothetical protein
MAMAAERAATTAATKAGEEAEVIRHHNGGWLRPWQPGKSGNPSGTGLGAYHAARRICAQATPEAARRQVELMSSNDERVAFMATEAPRPSVYKS